MAANPARDLLNALVAIDDYASAVPIIRATSVPLDANFYEKLWWQIGQWQAAQDPLVDRARRAFDYLWEFRYRCADADHLATPEAQAFVREILAKPSVGEMQGFALANQDRFSPNVVEALYAAKFFAEIGDRARLECLLSIAGGAQNALGMQLVHYPPGLYRDDFAGVLFESYKHGRMREPLAQLPVMLPLGFTIAGMLDSLRRDGKLGRDRPITDFVNFIEALALHLSERPVTDDDAAHDVAIYLYERLLELYLDEGFTEEYANTLANLESTRMRKGDG